VTHCRAPFWRRVRWRRDHLYALVHVTGLEPGKASEYKVLLDGERSWPQPASPFPPSVIRPMKNGETLKLVFGSCRISAPHEPPYTLGYDEDDRGPGRNQPPSARLLASLADVHREPLAWCLIHEATFFDNQIATLKFEDRHATITFEKAVLDAAKEPALKRLYQCRLA
jgi:hypothetical protein